MPRRNRARRTGPRALSGDLGEVRAESGPDGDWLVRNVPSATGDKSYRCPGCAQQIPAGTAHLVAWPADLGGLDERRHWHSPCWAARQRRRPR